MLEAILAALLALPPAHYPPGLDPETQEQREARMGIIAEAVNQAAAEATCQQPEADGCVRTWPGNRDQLAAMLLTQGWWESKYVWRVHAGKCRKDECDPLKVANRIIHRAHSPWQLQSSRVVPLREWRAMVGTDLQSTTMAAVAAARVLSMSRGHCAGSGQTWEVGTVSAYATGQHCAWAQAGERVKTYTKVLAKIRSVLHAKG